MLLPPSPTVVFGLCSAFYTCILLSGFLAADYSGCKWSLAESSSGEWIFVVVVWNNGIWLSSVCSTCSFRFLTMWCFLGLKGLYLSVSFIYLFPPSSFHTFKEKISDIGYIFTSRHPVMALSAASLCLDRVRAAG